LGVWLICSNAVALPPADEVVVVEVREGQSIRDIAEIHLGDANLWQELLRENNLQDITDIRPGLKLSVPAGRILRAKNAMHDSLNGIQQATQEGARVFAPVEISEAIRLYDEALSLRANGQWDDVTDRANQAKTLAQNALRLAMEVRDAAGQAVLSDREGWVEGRKSSELSWSDRTLHDVLVEQEKVRTLSDSSAQITFLDDNRLRLNANSQAVIYRMRVDPLSRREEAKVSLIEGDFYTALAGKSGRKSFELEIPDVETEIESRSYWVRHDARGSKFTNFDERNLRIAAKGESRDLGQNEAAVVRKGQKPSEKIKVVGAPDLSGPDDDSVAFTATVDLDWQPVEEAVGYWVEIAHDPSFNTMRASRWGLTVPRLRTEALDVGTYFWRVVGLDKFGLPGARSPVWRFHVRVDLTPPYLLIEEPKEGSIIRTGPVRLRGATEAGTELTIRGTTPTVGPDGAFQAEYTPEPGINRIVFTAKDSAGNVTERERSFVFAPDESAIVVFDEGIPRLGPRHFLTSRDVISLAGRTRPNAQVLIRTEKGEEHAAAYTDNNGHFGVNVPLRQPSEKFDLAVVERSGLTHEERFEVTVDQEAPEIALDSPPPSVTAVEWLPLKGRADGAITLSVNGQPTELDDDRFEFTVRLQEGPNSVEIMATDRVGNAGTLKLNVNLDQTPPTLVGHDVSKQRTSGGEPITVTVTANDVSGLKKVARFTLRIGSKEYTDYLDLIQENKTYQAVLNPPQEAVGAISLKNIELEDYAGNRAQFTLGSDEK
jgi:hypothetical protein